MDEQLNWSRHSDHIFKRLVSANFALSRSKGFLPTHTLNSIYQSLFESHLHFGSIVWGCAKQNILNRIDTLQKKAIRHVCNLKYNAHTAEYFRKHHYLTFNDLISFNQAIFMRNYTNKKLPSSFNNMLSPVPDNYRRRRDDDYNFISPHINFANLHHFPTPKLVYNWNNLPLTLKSVSEPLNFRTELLQHFTSAYETQCAKLNCYSCQNQK